MNDGFKWISNNYVNYGYLLLSKLYYIIDMHFIFILKVTVIIVYYVIASW